MISRILMGLGLAAALAASGCISVPEEVRRDMEPPDGSRPNNYGKFVETPDGWKIVPDRPTIPPGGDQ